MPANILPAALPVFLVLIVLEIIHLRKEHQPTGSNKDVVASVALGSCGLLISIFTHSLVIISYGLMYKFRLFTIPVNCWWAWVLCFFADDISYYWYHRMSHKIRFFWASHSVHHSAEAFTLASGLRVPWTGNITGLFLFWAWMPLLGFHPMMVIWFKSASIIYQFWMHTETVRRMPRWFEAIFNTPYHHRIHHASNTRYLDKNNAGTLIIWDKLFGTYIDETEKPVYGLAKKTESANPVVIAFQEWKNIYKDLKTAHNFKDIVNYTFNAPGWSNDGSTKTAKQLCRGDIMIIKSTAQVIN